MTARRGAEDRFLSCNGSAIRARRLAQGWTQDDLAGRSGYSRRLIQKAESGGSLAPATLRVLAQALSTDAEQVIIDDLTLTPLSVVQEFVAAMNSHYHDIGPAVEHLLADDFVLWSAGDPSVMPFAGEFNGRDAIVEYVRVFLSVLSPSKEGFLRKVRYLASGNEVVCWLEAHAQVKGMDTTPPVWVCHRYVVEGGKIARYENHFDTQTGSEHLAEARARGLLDADGQCPAEE